MSLAREFLADLGNRIAEEEAKVRERIDRISQYDDPDIDDRIKKEWNEFFLRVEPMRKQQEAVLRQIVDIEASKQPAPIIMRGGIPQ